MSYFEHRKDYIDKVQKILDEGGIIPFQEKTCYDEKLCAACTKAIEEDLGSFEDIGIDNFLAVIFGYLQYLTDHGRIAPIDSEYMSQVVLSCMIFASRNAAIVAAETIGDIVKAATDFGIEYNSDDEEDDTDE